jgi:S1-C subfamily serine protease
MEGPILRIPQLKIGKLEINRPSTALSTAKDGAFGMSAATDGTIGVPVMRRSKVIFDYPHSRAIIEPRQDFELPDSIDASGLALVRDIGADSAIKVAHVIKGSAGDAAGVKVGGEILSVDGVAVGNPNAQSARDLLRSAGKARQLLLRRGTDTLSVSIHLRMIV